MKKHFKIITLIIIWALYFISLRFTALTTASEDKFGGLIILLTGWLGVFAGMMSAVSWYANLFFLYISIQTLRGKKTSISHIFMLLLAIRAFFPMDLMLDEGGNTSKVAEHNLGFYLWFSAIVLLSILSFINWRMIRNSDN
ncbi:hypothetical protein [Gottfriedia acidiceleris]|uniref:hypothetical protein n=1 Tax=Gottfriedia acidiceleris TaxID=371036 RepID=UPI002FFDF56C